jgi:NAD(P)-dependent dehydrogenase (short-subunit alcohol dehydrogenase family)
MARILITGSSDGIGSLTARALIKRGHTVVLHARNAQRAKDAARLSPGSAAVLIADLTCIPQIRQLATEANKLGPFDAVLHNAGLYFGMERVIGESGLPSLFCVNVLAPFMLTCLMDRPKRLVYVSSGMHRSGRARLDASSNGDAKELKGCNYSDSKLYDVMLAKYFARRFDKEGVACNAVDPGWVPTKMGGRGAPDDIQQSVEAFVMLALGEGAAKGKTGKFFKTVREATPNRTAEDEGLQDRLVRELERIGEVQVPNGKLSGRV